MTEGQPRPIQAAAGPEVAILIPCLNEERYIARCLDSLLVNDYDPSLVSILVFEGGSTDGTREIVEAYARLEPRVAIVDNPTARKSVALNRGIGMTTAPVIIRADAHATYAPDYIRRLVEGLAVHGADNIGGFRDTYHGATAVERAIATAIAHPFAAGNAYWRTGADEPREVDTVFCGCYPRGVFDRVGTFNTSLVRAEDREFNFRLRAAGGRIVLDPSIRCTYYPRTTMWEYAKWTAAGAFWLFYGRRLTTVKMIAWRNMVPLVFVLWHAAAVLMVAAGAPGWRWMLAPMGAYWLVAMSLAARVAWRQRDPLQVALVAWLFGVTHYVYGVAALWGMARAAAPGRPAPVPQASVPNQ
jgi:glycosyltransferase involved in cell wall biosynthesis